MMQIIDSKVPLMRDAGKFIQHSLWQVGIRITID